ncbi:Protein pxr1 [Penicillium herquei]|nr:Protein pxr1 [Penicillium herquei]
MGLAAPKKKTKISHDPNNTKWARSTSGFGHKIMSAQGWTPGGRLGARDAAHADLLTAASHSHIKVTIKDDNLGLGARLARESEPTGQDAFKGLLGRLNGKSEAELQKDERKSVDVKLARYVALKFPEVRFVRGGLLAQQKLDALPAKPQEKKSESGGNDQQDQDDDDSSSDSSTSARKSSKSKSKSKKSKSKSKSKSKKSRSRSDDDSEEDSSSESESKKKKKSKKRKAESDESSKPAVVPTTTTVVREHRPLGRQVFRGRHIAQKKRALMDDKSLNEIFMIKAVNVKA